MRYVKLWVETGFVGARYEEVIGVPDNCTDEELELTAREYLSECVEYGWSEADEDDYDW